jgi:hypothetical protein
MQEALRAGVERVVYTSSVATLGLRADGGPADESVPLSVEEGIGAYKRSKIAAERLVEAMVGRDRLPAVIVNPSTPVGPRDVKPTPTGRIIVEAARGRMPGFLDTGLNFVHVDDVAEGHLAALRRGVIGERYILGGENVVLADMLAEVARLAGRRPPRFRIPRRHDSGAYSPRRRPDSPAVNRSRPWTGCASRNTTCSSPRPRPSAISAFARGPTGRRSPTRSIGSAPQDIWTAGGNTERARLVGPERRARQFRSRVAAGPLRAPQLDYR